MTIPIDQLPPPLDLKLSILLTDPTHTPVVIKAVDHNHDNEEVLVLGAKSEDGRVALVAVLIEGGPVVNQDRFTPISEDWVKTEEGERAYGSARV